MLIIWPRNHTAGDSSHRNKGLSPLKNLCPIIQKSRFIYNSTKMETKHPLPLISSIPKTFPTHTVMLILLNRKGRKSMLKTMNSSLTVPGIWFVSNLGKTRSLYVLNRTDEKKQRMLEDIWTLCLEAPSVFSTCFYSESYRTNSFISPRFIILT